MVVAEHKFIGDAWRDHIDKVPRPARAGLFAKLGKGREAVGGENPELLAFTLRVVYPAEEEIGLGVNVPIIAHHFLVLVKVIGILKGYEHRRTEIAGIGKETGLIEWFYEIHKGSVLRAEFRLRNDIAWVWIAAVNLRAGIIVDGSRPK